MFILENIQQLERLLSFERMGSEAAMKEMLSS